MIENKILYIKIIFKNMWKHKKEIENMQVLKTSFYFRKY